MTVDCFTTVGKIVEAMLFDETLFYELTIFFWCSAFTKQQTWRSVTFKVCDFVTLTLTHFVNRSPFSNIFVWKLSLTLNASQDAGKIRFNSICIVMPAFVKQLMQGKQFLTIGYWLFLQNLFINYGIFSTGPVGQATCSCELWTFFSKCRSATPIGTISNSLKNIILDLEKIHFHLESCFHIGKKKWQEHSFTMV